MEFNKAKRTYFKFEQFDDGEPSVEAYGDPVTLMAAAFSLISAVVDQFPETYELVRIGHKHILNVRGTKEDKRQHFWSSVREIAWDACGCLGVLSIFLFVVAKIVAVI